MTRQQWLEETPGAIYLSIAASLLLLAEGRENLDISQVIVTPELLDQSLVKMAKTSRKVSIAVNVTQLQEVYNVGDLTIEVKSGNVKDGVGLLRLYERTPVNVVALDRELLRHLAQETSSTGVEYMLIYLEDGKVAVLEGERFRVSVPFVNSLAMLHTHPSGACGLSQKDLKSGIELLTEEGLFSGAVTPECAYIMYREGLVDEEDFIRVKKGELRDLRTVKFMHVNI